MSIVGSSMTALGVGRALLGREAEVGETLRVAVGEPRELDVDAGAAAEVLPVTAQDLDTPDPTVPRPMRPTLHGAHEYPPRSMMPHTPVRRGAYCS